LTTIRVGNRQKKIDISIPKFDSFIHKVYINVGRKIYRNVDLFIIDIPPLAKMKNRRIVENIIEKCILDTIRDNMPFEHIIRSYLDESEEHEEEVFDVEEEPDNVMSTTTATATANTTANTTANDDNTLKGDFNGPQIINLGGDEPIVTKVSFDPIPIIHSVSNDAEEITPTLKPIRKLNEIATNDDNNRIQFLEDGIDATDISDLNIFDLNTNKLPNANPSNAPLLRGSSGQSNDLELNEIDFDAL
jgi:hypothetical protein